MFHTINASDFSWCIWTLHALVVSLVDSILLDDVCSICCSQDHLNCMVLMMEYCLLAISLLQFTSIYVYNGVQGSATNSDGVYFLECNQNCITFHVQIRLRFILNFFWKKEVHIKLETFDGQLLPRVQTRQNFFPITCNRSPNATSLGFSAPVQHHHYHRDKLILDRHRLLNLLFENWNMNKLYKSPHTTLMQPN